MSVFKRKRIVDGVTIESETYYYKFTFQGKQYPRRTPDTVKAEAEKREAAHLYLLQKGLFAEADKIRLRRATTTTIGQVIAAYQHYAPLQQQTDAAASSAATGPRRFTRRKHSSPDTIRENIGCLRRIIRDVHFPDPEFTTLTPELITEIDALPATVLCSSLLTTYQNLRLKAAGADELMQETAKTTANGTIRQARSVVGRKIAPAYTASGLVLPALEAFWNVQLFEEPDHSFEPIPDELITKLWTSSKDLKASDPNAYRAFLLSICCGLRRKEIANLRRSEIIHRPAAPAAVVKDGGANVPVCPDNCPPQVRHFIPLRTKKGFKTKTGKARLVPLEHAVWLELESLKPIVAMPATAPVDPGADITTAVSADYVLTGSAHERLEESFRRLGTWMTGLGFNRKKKAHELRKHFGSAAADQLGDRIAPKLLGNSADVFHAHYDAMRVTPEVKMFQAG